MLAKPSAEAAVALLFTAGERVSADTEEEEEAPSLTSATSEEDPGRQHKEEEEAGWCEASGGCGCGGGGGGGSGGGCWAGADTTEEPFFSLLSLAESRQAHWHWQDSSCLMMITGKLRPIC